MTNPHPHECPTVRPALRRGRRGSVYAMVLGVTMLITVIGIGALATARITTRATNAATDWQQAGALALSAAEQAISKLNADAAANPTTWRDAYTDGALAFDYSMDTGKVKWVLVDEGVGDDSINDDYSDPIRLYGVGRAGSVTRCYSVQLNATGSGIEALRTVCHAAGGVVVNGTTVAVGGPVSTNGNFSGSGTVAGPGGTDNANKPMPSPTQFDSYRNRSGVADISGSVASSFTPNGLGATASNPDGIYYIHLSDTVGTLTIQPGRLRATLLIENNALVGSQSLVIAGGSTWQASKADFPLLITKGIKTVTFNGSRSVYSDGSGDYVPELKGLVHLIGTNSVVINANVSIRGCVLADGTITFNGTQAMTSLPSLYTKPPIGYTKGNHLVPAAGTWRWDTAPASAR